MPTRLLANGIELHPYMPPPPTTQTLEFDVPRRALDATPELLSLTVEPDHPDRVTFVQTSVPVAELWIVCKKPAAAT